MLELLDIGEIFLGVLWVIVGIINLAIGIAHMLLMMKIRKYEYTEKELPATHGSRMIVGGILMYIEFIGVEKFFRAFLPSYTKSYLESLYKPALLRKLKDKKINILTHFIINAGRISFPVTGLFWCMFITAIFSIFIVVLVHSF